MLLGFLSKLSSMFWIFDLFSNYILIGSHCKSPVQASAMLCLVHRFS